MYSVVVGRQTGIFLDWAGCSIAVSDHPGAIFRKWETLREATQHLNKCGIKHEEILVYAADCPLQHYTLQEYCRRQSILVPAEVGYERCSLFHIAHGLFVEACRYNNQPRIDIRQWDTETNKRTKKGISLTHDQWLNFLALTPCLESDLAKVKDKVQVDSSHQLGDGVYVTINTPYKVFHIRKWFCDGDVLKPGRQGITLRETEWRHLVHLKEQLALASSDCSYSIDAHYGYRY